MNLESPSAKFSDYVLQELQDIFVNNKRLIVVERANLELLRNEVQFRTCGEMDENTAVSLGKRLGAEVIVAGNLTDLNGRYIIQFNATNVETAARKASPAVTVRQDNDIAALLPAGPDPALAYFNAGFANYEA